MKYIITILLLSLSSIVSAQTTINITDNGYEVVHDGKKYLFKSDEGGNIIDNNIIETNKTESAPKVSKPKQFFEQDQIYREGMYEDNLTPVTEESNKDCKFGIVLLVIVIAFFVLMFTIVLSD